MKKTLILTSLLAIMATGVASADTDVTFAGDYQLGNGSTANVGTPLSGLSYTYTYEKTDGSTATVAQSVDPNLTFFTYTDKNGDPANLSSGEQTQADFTGTSVATGDITTTQEIVAGATANRANYQYVDGAGNTVTLGETAQRFTETVVLNEEYTAGASVNVTDGVAGTFSGALYTYTDPDTGAIYHLNSDGTAWVDANNMVQTPEVGSPQEAAHDAMIAAYAADLASVNAAITSTGDAATDEVALFAAANTVFTTDANTIQTLDGYYNTYVAATELLNDALDSQSAAVETFNADLDLQTAASGLYNSPIETTITNGANDAIDTSVAGGTIKTALDGKQENLTDSQLAAANSGITADKVSAYDAYATAISDETTRATGVEASLDGRITDNATAIAAETTRATGAEAGLATAIVAETTRATTQEAAIRSEFVAADAETLASAKAYSDAGDELTLNAAKSYAEAGDAIALNQAKAYADERVEKLDKDLSAGVASAIALSSVSVSGVKRGEVSVGGGYGYFNGQSAAAFGAAMGLSDRWSINAGAGVSNADIAVRAGTNYKFKLF